MNYRNKLSRPLAACLMALAAAGTSQAGVVNTANVGSQAAFIDTSTGLTWLDLDNFWTPTATYTTIVASLVGSGFHLATAGDLAALQASIPAVPANFAAEAPIVGGNYVGKPGNGSRDLLWGIYEDGDSSDGVSYSYKFGLDTPNWSIGANSQPTGGLLIDANSADRDLGAWVVSDAVLNGVPEPTTSALVGLGLFAAAALRRKRRG